MGAAWDRVAKEVWKGRMMGKDKAHMFAYLWRLLAENLPMPEAEYNFDKELGRRHRFDFAFLGNKVAIEVEGNAWAVKGGGRHMQDSDLEKYNLAALLGWRVVRFSPGMLKRDPEGCIKLVKDCLRYE